MTIEIFVPGIPCGWARARGGKTTHHYTADKQRAAGEVIAYGAKAAMKGRPLVTGPVQFDLLVIYPWPKSWSLKKRDENWRKVSKPDLDNHLKLALDSLNGIVWHDDAQVCSATVTKRYGETPGLHITITPLCGE